jgi:hypothetical protein
MTRQQLELLQEAIEAQKRWALLHGGDQELVDLLRTASDRLFVMTRSPAGARDTSRPWPSLQ